MKLVVNGQTIEVPASITAVEELLHHLSLNKDFAIVEQNGAILEKQEWDKVKISAADRFEIVQFVGGG
ncbi:sulfur carrier protein ThiS [Bacillus sp. N9]